MKNPWLRLLAGLCVLAPVFAADPALQSILSSRETRIDMARKQYDAAVRVVDQDTLQRLRSLQAARTSSGDLDGAMAVRKLMDDIQGHPATPGGGTLAQAQTQDQAEAAIELRFLELHRALLAGNLDGALKFVDPKNLQFVQPATAKAYLGLMAFGLKAGKVEANDIKVKNVRVGVKGNEAEVIGRYRVNGQWADQKPGYWVLRENQWYIGDERELANLK
jgi:hypothetical protein